jgi:putative spermidine/putrescine transport system permease protein
MPSDARLGPNPLPVTLAAVGSGRPQPRRTGTRWEWFLWPAVLVSLALLVLPQANFIWLSFHADLGLGQTSDAVTGENYVRLLTDSFYLSAFWLTIYLSGIAAGFGLLVGFPAAYALARIGGWIASFLLSLILTTSLITVVVKLIGLDIILGSNGLVNQLILALGFTSSPIQMINNEFGVFIGLIQYTLPMTIVLLFGVVQTIPVSLEEAATILGATRARTYWEVILPSAKAGLLSSGLIAFNMNMGAFTSAVLLGGGRVRTIPVLIQQIIIQDTDYGKGAALSTTLVGFTFLINVAVAALSFASSRRPRGQYAD